MPSLPQLPDAVVLLRSREMFCTPYGEKFVTGVCQDRFAASNKLDTEDTSNGMWSKCVGCSVGEGSHQEAARLIQIGQERIEQITALAEEAKLPTCMICLKHTEHRNLGMDGRCNTCRTGGRVRKGAGPLRLGERAAPPPTPVNRPKPDLSVLPEYLQLLTALAKATVDKVAFEQEHPELARYMKKMMDEVG